MNEPTDQELQQQARKALDRRVAGLDAATRSRLTQARHRAVAAAQATPSTRWLGWRVAGAAAALAGIALTVLLIGEPAPILPPGGPMFSELELIEVDADLELVAEPEFYDWLAQVADAPDDA